MFHLLAGSESLKDFFAGPLSFWLRILTFMLQPGYAMYPDHLPTFTSLNYTILIKKGFTFSQKSNCLVYLRLLCVSMFFVKP